MVQKGLPVDSGTTADFLGGLIEGGSSAWRAAESHSGGLETSAPVGQAVNVAPENAANGKVGPSLDHGASASQR